MRNTEFSHSLLFSLNFRVWAPEKWLGSAQYSLDIIQESLNYLENLFRSKFPLSKIDFIVAYPFGGEALTMFIEHQLVGNKTGVMTVFAMLLGAMENWGLIIHEAQTLLETNITIAGVKPNLKNQICEVITHEVRS